MRNPNRQAEKRRALEMVNRIHIQYWTRNRRNQTL